MGVSGQCGANSLDHAVRILQNVVIPEPQHTKSLRCEPACTLCICSDPVSVLAAVDFNHQPSFIAEKVDDKSSDRSLAPEAVAIDGVAS